MLSTSTGLIALLSASSALMVNGAAFPQLFERAAGFTGCSPVTDWYNTLGANQQNNFDQFCIQYLALVPKTTTSTKSTIVKTKNWTTQSTTTTTRTASPQTKTATANVKVTSRTTTTPNAVDSTVTVTSTAFIDNQGNTIGFAKRDASPTLQARAIATPTLFKKWSKADVKSGCRCNGYVASTLTVKKTVQVTATNTIAQTKTAIKTTTLPVPLTTLTQTSTRTVTVTAPAPVNTVSVTYWDDESQCYPGSTTTLVCPESTGDDTGDLSDQNEMDCPSINPSGDGYWGSCDYYEDDGSPVGSQFCLTDSDADGNETSYCRDAIYDDTETADCPASADWTCAPDAAPLTGKRSTVYGFDSEVEPAKRWYEMQSSLVERAKKHGKKAHRPKQYVHSGHYHPYSTVKAKIHQS